MKIYVYSKQHKKIFVRVEPFAGMIRGHMQCKVYNYETKRIEPWRKSDLIKVTKEKNPEFFL